MKFPAFRLMSLGVLGLVSCVKPAPVPSDGVKASTPVKSQSRPVARGRASVMSLEVFFDLQQKNRLRIYDARPSLIYALGHIPGAVNWPRSQVETMFDLRKAEVLQAQAADQVVVLYCTDKQCPDARLMAERLAEKGLSVSILEGGFSVWKEAGLPVE